MGQPPADEFGEFGLGQVGPFGADEGDGPLAPAAVGPGYHRGLDHVGVGGERFFHFD